MHDCPKMLVRGLGIFIVRMLPLILGKIAKKDLPISAVKNWVPTIPAFVIAQIVIIRTIGHAAPNFA